MARKMTEWPSKRGPITKIMPSDGCIGDTPHFPSIVDIQCGEKAILL